MTDDFRKFIHGTADAGAFLGILFTVAGLFGQHHHIIEVFTQAKIPLALCFAGYIGLKLIFRCHRTATLCVIPFLLNAAPPMMLLLPQRHQDLPVNPVDIKVLQANVLTSNRNAGKLLQLVNDIDPDVIVLQETNRRWLFELKELKKKYPVFAEHPREDNFGAAIFCKNTNAVASIEFLSDPEMLPLSKVVIHDDDKQVIVFGAHPLAPLNPYLWEWRNKYTLELAEVLSQLDSPVIVTGDLNNTPWAHYFKQFKKQSGLLDASQGRGPLPTWPTGQAVLPLDHCFHSEDVVIQKRQRGPDIGSDHYPLIIEAEY